MFFFCFGINNANAQLQANFTADKQGGCSPLNVKFTNTTTGASAAATWAWNFGNGNSSTLKDPGATYFTEKNYTVTLTVKDGSFTSTKTLEVIVYKKPTVDFTVSPAKGCVPLTTTFTSNSTAGDGTIANYLWDFGDGTNIQGSNYMTASHVYTFPQKPPVTLNVTNSYGCYTTLTKNNQVEAVKGVIAAFTLSANTLCNAGESITFTNTSTGSGILTYKWDFGDGSATSTDKSPTHAYAVKGTYAATLTVTSSDGCAATLKSDNISVANFKADFTFPSKICLNQYVTFSNTSTTPFTSVEWWIDNNNYGNSYYNGDLFTSFSQPGQYAIKLVMYYGGCSVTTIKNITVTKVPILTGFIAELQGACGVPVTIKFKDTSSQAVAWEWKSNFGNTVFATTQNTAHTYTDGSYDYVYLTVKNAEGCSTTVVKYINYEKPNIYINLTSTAPTQGCKVVTASFAATPDTAIKDYKWNFNDGTPTSTESNPTHTFTKPGTFSVMLEYTTNNGCKGTVYYNYIIVIDKPVFNFTASATTICGNTLTTFTATPVASGWSYYWSFNDTSDYNNYYYSYSTITKQFRWDTTYTVKLILYNQGCTDTIIKKDYVKVLPPFPHIQQLLNTCDASRGTIRFTETSLKALSWKWEFGDGGTNSYTAFKDTIRHTYNSTGSFKVVLSATNGSCTVRDSTTAYVLLKQKPVLTSTKTDACGSDVVNFKLAGFEKNPYPYNYYYYSYYYISNKQYGDLTNCAAPTYLANDYWTTEVTGTLQSLDPGKNDLRMITTSAYFSCPDTSNFIPIKIHGPKAGFKIETHSGCFKDPVIFTDTSQKFGSTTIVKWEWDFGDNKSQTLTTGGSTKHTYSNPGYYYIRLKVTDADGCSNQNDYYVHGIAVDGPKADFNPSAYIVPSNTTVYFYNASQYYNSYYYSTLRWIFSDSTTSTDPNPSFLFTGLGTFPVTLITTNTQTGCTDTIQKIITVRKVNSAFTYRLSYINNNSCPPVIATFTSISTNAIRLSWDFGDGGIAGDQKIVSHTYNNPGIYRVVHYSYDSNNAVDSTEDFIEVKGPYALLKADTLYACTSLQVTLTADVKYASEYTWDFGDGTVVPTTDTMAVHNYLTPGIYVPALILKDAGGCTATSLLPQKIIVDSLAASFAAIPSVICDSAISIFTPQVTSLSNQLLQSPLQYIWVTNQAAVSDTSNNITGSHLFNKIGTHTVSLTVTSPYGCLQKTTKTITVKEGVNASIAGIDKLCQGQSESFKGSATPATATINWHWNFGNGATAAIQNPAPQTYNSTGLQQVTLIADNGFCFDTVYHPLIVNPNPVIGFTPTTPFVCQGSSAQLTASGGSIYQWRSIGALSNAAAATATASPTAGVFYFVKVTDAVGCSSKDSVFVKVIDPLTVKVPASLFACEGSTVQLNATGADTYKWINNTDGINDINAGNASALPAASITYTVVGYDNYNCFTDTAGLFVRISQLPIVNAGEDQQLIAGTAVTLTPTVSGAVNWIWSPADYLNCTSCLHPISKPKASATYTFTAYNSDGCSATDRVTLQLICKSDLVYIPNAFSPNNDNLNDRFNISGSGVKSIRSIIIYNRWGKVMFERKNININDRNNSWDGTFNGEPMPPGAYVYWINTECEGGEIFNYRGTVMIVR